jgi:rubredoxin
MRFQCPGITGILKYVIPHHKPVLGSYPYTNSLVIITGSHRRQTRKSPAVLVKFFALHYTFVYKELVMKYKCEICGYVYDPAEGEPGNGYNPGTPFEDLPAAFICCECGAGKDAFKPE